ncbi:MAG TPA: ABC transporter ATP-binding protein, partial [Candidatus Polarisedimenticolia bacterium]|nr:ABC transporter ATP-binding protein [Candidatus Polarisedimenticolia bacterium]
VLTLEGVAKSYRTHLSLRKYWILKDLSFEVHPGEIFGFIGTNGAGKTTTIKLVLGLLFPDSGTIRLCGEDPARPEARRRVGFLPENPYFHDYLTGAEFLDFHARLHGFRQPERRKRVGELLERVGLTNRADRALRLYSKGMLQRIGLAQALLHDPDVVILDEPMSGLDPIGRRDVRDLILELKRRGRTVFFSTHILSDTETICDRVGMLVRGRLAAIGTVEELVRGEVESWEVTLAWPGPGNPPIGQVLSRRDDRVLLQVGSQADLHRLVASLNGGGARLVAVSPARRSLEDLLVKEVRGATGAGERAS